ncbi:gamma-glutamylcyclotransferase family protein [Joostella sp. CR20]|uniref:gamma-glutamylcyclotransferase family protein n=1 Tax=Joostella sp. CR20 TaxID=2804312 RepID=UPI00313ECC4A
MYFFVYGTLRKKSNNPIAKKLHANSVYIGKGNTPGRLYNLGNFPGAVFETTSKNLIYGDVFKVETTNKQLEKLLDDYEGIDDPSFNYYKKTTALIQVGTTQIKAVVYHLIIATDSFQLIESGDYNSFL